MLLVLEKLLNKVSSYLKGIGVIDGSCLPAGDLLYLKVSHRASLLLPRRNGSLKSATGYKYTSELEPSA